MRCSMLFACVAGRLYLYPIPRGTLSQGILLQRTACLPLLPGANIAEKKAATWPVKSFTHPEFPSPFAPRRELFRIGVSGQDSERPVELFNKHHASQFV